MKSCLIGILLGIFVLLILPVIFLFIEFWWFYLNNLANYFGIGLIK